MITLFGVLVAALTVLSMIAAFAGGFFVARKIYKEKEDILVDRFSFGLAKLSANDGEKERKETDEDKLESKIRKQENENFYSYTGDEQEDPRDHAQLR